LRAGRRPDEAVGCRDLTEDNLSRARAAGQGPKVIPVKPTQACAEFALSEANGGVLDRTCKDDVDTDDLGASVERRADDPSDVARPSERGRPLERRRAVGLFVQRYHHRCRRFCRMAGAKNSPSQSRLGVNRPASQQTSKRNGDD
jgi:hypothetical protein